jgi:hypothetical protein
MRLKHKLPLYYYLIYEVDATGGVITYDGDYVIHTFSENGNFILNDNINVEMLVVGAGGSGTGASGGGGGAGQVIWHETYPLTVGDYSIEIGTNTYLEDGTETNFNDLIIATGGGRGGSGWGDNGNPGGNACGGGGAGGRTSFGSGGTGHKNGGDGVTDWSHPLGGGGGGYGEDGHTALQGIPGKGGNGIICAITGDEIYYGGGGGGGMWDSVDHPIGQGGLGGGGNGASATIAPQAGTDGLGGGGGSGSRFFVGAKGGSGIVIIRYYKYLPKA